MADFDQNGWKDIFVANGYLRDMQDKDYIKRAKEINGQSKTLDKKTFDEITVSQKLRNYLYMNGGNLQFESLAKQLGLTERTFSTGAA